jgi:hypothetical protein
MDLVKHCIVQPGSKLRLKHRDPDDTFGRKRDDKDHQKTLDRLRELQHLLYADKRYSLLICTSTSAGSEERLAPPLPPD